jgi:hypothetical protein
VEALMHSPETGKPAFSSLPIAGKAMLTGCNQEGTPDSSTAATIIHLPVANRPAFSRTGVPSGTNEAG